MWGTFDHFHAVNLAIETGRHHRPPIRSSSRLCPCVPCSALGMSFILYLSVQFSSQRQVSHPFNSPNFFKTIPLCPAGAYDFVQTCFRLYRHHKQLVLMFLIRSLLTLTHLCNLVGWWKMYILLLIVLQITVFVLSQSSTNRADCSDKHSQCFVALR